MGAELQEEWQGYLHFNVVSDVSLADQFAQCEAVSTLFFVGESTGLLTTYEA